MRHGDHDLAATGPDIESLSLSYTIIEHADATPPHLEVTLRLVSSDGVQGSGQVFAFGLLS